MVKMKGGEGMEDIRRPLSVDEVLDLVTVKLVEINEAIDLLEIGNGNCPLDGYRQMKQAIITVAAIRACKGFNKQAVSLFPHQVREEA